VDRARDEALARPRLAGDQHGQRRVHDARHEPVERLHGGRAAHEREVGAGLAGLRAARGGASLLVERARGAAEEVGQVEGLGQVVEGLGLGRAHGGGDGVLGRDDDDRQAGAGPAIRGSCSRPLPSGMTTSEMTRSPLPSSTQRMSVTSDEVAWTLQPARVRACVRTVRIVRSSSATSTVPSISSASQALFH
jgi:hypothetical protein